MNCRYNYETVEGTCNFRLDMQIQGESMSWKFRCRFFNCLFTKFAKLQWFNISICLEMEVDNQTGNGLYSLTVQLLHARNFYCSEATESKFRCFARSQDST